VFRRLSGIRLKKEIKTQARHRRSLSLWIKGAAIVALALLAGTLSACSRSSTAIIISGSTSVQPYAEILAEEYAHIRPDIQIDVLGGGSSAGVMAAEDGTAAIGMSSRELTEAELELWHVMIAKDGLAVVVHPNNPIQDLTLEQVRDIYSAQITNWSELGGTDARIHVITREEGSGTRSAFESLVMGKEAFITQRAIVQDSNGAVRQLISDDRNAIGFLSLGLVEHSDSIRSLLLDGVEATAENVMNGRYNLYRPFLFITKEEPVGEVKAFIDFVLSPEGQALLAHEGLIPRMEGNE